MKSALNLLSIAILLASLLGSCKTMLHTNKALKENKNSASNKLTSTAPKDESMLAKIKRAEKDADKPGKAVLEIGRKMALEEKVIIKGSCWNWVNECFKRAGYGT
jgi:hypothetical protein